MKFDYLIVGQGIAGSTIALELYKRGKKVIIISKDNLSQSSAVAAGIYNPFNFRRTTPLWEARAACAAADLFYSKTEVLTDVNFHQRKKIIRVFADADEHKRWQEYLAQAHHDFAVDEETDQTLASKINAPFGTGILHGGVLDTGKYLHAVREFFIGKNAFRDEIFHEELLEASASEVVYNDIIASKIIFCEGHLAMKNKFTTSVPIVPSKGETLHVSIPGLQLDDVINGLVYVAPLGNDLYTCGATYAPGRTDEEITGEAREDLLRKLSATINIPFRAESQFAGVRPAGRDRKPVIGKLNENPNISIFNGMGSKGVLLAPYLAQLLADNLENNAEIPHEISTQRFRQKN